MPTPPPTVASPEAGATSDERAAGPVETEVVTTPSGSDRLRRVLPPVLVVGTYCLIAVLAYWPVSPFSSTRIMHCGCQDAAQEAWFLGWPVYALTHLHNPFFSGWIGVPHGVNLADITSMPLLGVVAWPVTKLAGPIAGYNFVLRLGFATSATAAFFVVRRWARWTPAAFVAGLIYGFSPYMVGEGLGHAFLMFAPFPPLIFLAVERLVVGRTRSAVQLGLVLGVLCALQFYISTEVLVTTVGLAVAGVVIAAVVCPGHLRGSGRRMVTGAGAAAAVLVVGCGYAAWFAFRGPRHITGPPHAVDALAPYHADLLSGIIPTASEHFAPWHLWAVGDRLTGFNTTETGAYLGIPLLILLGVVVVRYWRDPKIRVATALAVLSYLLSLGATLEVDGVDTHIPLPFAVLTHLPVVQGILSGRFSMYTAFFAAVVLAIGLDRWRADLRGRHAVAWRWGLLAMTAVALVPLIPSFPYQEVDPQVPAYFTSPAVQRIPAGSTVLAYPYPYTPQVQAMLWSAASGMRFRIVGGQAAIPGPGGRTTAAPLTLQPASVEAIFLDAMNGSPRIMPTVPPLDANALAQLREFCAEFHVDTVVIDPIGVDPQLAVNYVTASFGRQPDRQGGVDVWYDTDGAAGAPAGSP